MPTIPFDDDGRYEIAEPPELSEAAKHALARQQKLDDANFITERTLAFKNEMAAEFERSKRDGDAADPMFEPNIMKFGFEMRSSLLSDIPRGPRGRLISQEAIEKTRSNMEGAMERFSTAALHRLNLERHSRAFANIEAAGEEFAKAAGRDARGLQGLLSTVDNLMDRYEGVFADEEIADQRARLRTGTVIAAINGLIEQGKTGFARELIQKGAFGADLGDQPARLLLGRIAKSERDNARNAAKQADKAKTVAVADLDFRVATGQAFAEELDFEFEEGTISVAEYAEFLAELEQQDEDSARRADGMVRVKGKLANGEKPDPDDPADRAAMDVLFDDLVEANAGRPPEERANIETRFVRRTGMLPDALRDSLLAGMFSEDPAAQVAAAGRFVAFDEADPALVVPLPADILDRARTITAFAYPGLTPARIVQLADERVAQQEGEAVQAEGEEGKDREVEPGTPPGTPQQPATGGSGTQTQVSHAAGKAGSKQAQPLVDPLPQSPVSKRFRDEIAKAEQSTGYQDENPSSRAWGRYQLTPIARQDIGLERRDGSLTGKYGVNTKKEFLNDPVAQEKAFADVMKRNEEQLRVKKNNAVQYLGQQIDGVKAKFKISSSGLLAAAYREGARAVRQYLDHQKANKWVSNPKIFPAGSNIFRSIETRLRVFENIPHKSP
ncbi:MAG: hypothetical protein IH904_03060 [Proteobacteria bacterium]|nr:hypothetical protein [Pseudomonadota bacterium]